MALNVDFIYFYPLENSRKHHTERFEIIHTEPKVPVLRRGQEFTITVRFSNRQFIRQKDTIKILFNCGSHPNPLKGTQGIIFVNEKEAPLDHCKWNGKITNIHGNEVVIELMTPCDAPVGPYEIVVESSYGTQKSSYTYDGDFWLLFNPWMKDDLVYMPEQALLDEYVLSDVGKVWVGPMGSTRGREWVYGQFDKCVLPAIVLMLDRANLIHQNRNDPILMTRAISRIVNSNDDHGVLVGRWDGDYHDGIGPSAWTGSVDILDQFLSTEVEVKYGQCWVFAGVVTTVCRALGIPSRVISNLVSAHDSNGSLTVDKYFDKDNNEMNFDPTNPNGEDSVWNYHVWNDVHMARPDLPKGYGGWQAVDATPQETSDGLYQCGPASLEAIRRGEVGLNYDVPFMIASVNADFMKWKQDDTSVFGYKRLDSNQYHIGRLILTKQPWIFDPNGDKDREDITYQYKQAEGSKGERLALYNAVRNTARAKRYYEIPDIVAEDIDFKLSDLERVDIGDPFTVTLEFKNKSTELRTVEVMMTAGSVYYTGIRANTIKKSSGEVKVKPGATEVIKMTVKPDDYLESLVEYSIMKIYAICTVKETKQTWAGEDDLQVIKPPINIKLNDEINVNETVQAKLSFKNPLPKLLTKCQFNLSGPGIIRRTIMIPFRDCRPKETLIVHASITPWKPGKYTFVATFTSKELSDITGSAVVEVF